MKYVFMGSPSIARSVLKYLLDHGASPELVVTQAAKPAGRGNKLMKTDVAQFATEKGIPLLETENINSPEVVQKIRAVQADIFLVVAFGQILKEEVLGLPKMACLNVHASLLPRWRGAAPVQRALLAGDKVTGIAIQKMARKLDTGDILAFREIQISESDTSISLWEKMATEAGPLCVGAFTLLQSGKARFQPQDEAQATYAQKLEKSEGLIHWTESCQMIHRRFRAFQPWPGVWFDLCGVSVRILDCAIGEKAAGLQTAGTVTTDSKSSLSVVCGDGRLLNLFAVQPEGKRPLQIKDFLAGYRQKLPSKLE
jgi:methionyl-tRNA formyltransferase